MGKILSGPRIQFNLLYKKWVKSSGQSYQVRKHLIGLNHVVNLIMLTALSIGI